MQSGPDEMLTSGLMVKEAPKLFKPNHLPPPKAALPTVNNGGYPLPPSHHVDADSSRMHTDDLGVVESNTTATMSSHYNVKHFTFHLNYTKNLSGFIAAGICYPMSRPLRRRSF